MKRFLKVSITLLLVFFSAIILINNSFILCREIKNYDTIFEIVGTNIVITHSPIGIRYNLLIRDTNHSNDIYCINTTSSVCAVCKTS